MASGRHACQMRFTKEYELCTHMELTHGWNVDDINDALGNQMEGVDGAEEEAANERLRQELEKELDGYHAAGKEVSMGDV